MELISNVNVYDLYKKLIIQVMWEDLVCTGF
jgi:hypothetical protein